MGPVKMSRACGGDSGGAGEIMLFGVRVVVDAIRKSVSMNNLCQYEQHQEEGSKVSVINKNNNGKEDVAAAGYASADDAVPNSRANRERERKRGQIQIADNLSLYFPSQFFNIQVIDLFVANCFCVPFFFVCIWVVW